MDGHGHPRGVEETGIQVGTDRAAQRAAGLGGGERLRDLPRGATAMPPGVTHNTEHVFGLCVPRDTPITLAPREHIAHGPLRVRQAAADRCFSPSNPRRFCNSASVTPTRCTCYRRERGAAIAAPFAAGMHPCSNRFQSSLLRPAQRHANQLSAWRPTTSTRVCGAWGPPSAWRSTT